VTMQRTPPTLLIGDLGSDEGSDSGEPTENEHVTDRSTLRKKSLADRTHEQQDEIHLDDIGEQSAVTGGNPPDEDLAKESDLDNRSSPEVAAASVSGARMSQDQV
jgi:hypothetical protein